MGRKRKGEGGRRRDREGGEGDGMRERDREGGEGDGMREREGWIGKERKGGILERDGEGGKGAIEGEGGGILKQ